MIDIQAGNLDKKGKSPGITITDQVHVECLGSLIEVGEHKPGMLFARRDFDVNAILEEMLLQLLPCLDTLVKRRNFERGQIVFIQAYGQERHASRRLVLNLEPYRLDALIVQANAEDRPGLLRTRDGRGNGNAVVGLRLRSLFERHLIQRLRFETGRASAEQQE